MINFGEYLPDMPPLDNPGLLDARNVFPGSTGYRPVPAATPYSTNTLDTRPQGAFSVTDNTPNAQIYTFVGTSDKLYQLDINSWTNVSKGGGYATTEEDDWEFVHWGNDVIATNFSDEIQSITFGDSNFADLSGDAPKAAHITTVKDFLVVGNTYDSSDGYQPQRVRWAGIGSSTSWNVSATTQADFQDLKNDGGAIQKIIGGEFGLIFQKSAITRMSYIGSPLIFQFDLLESQRGVLSPGSVIKVGNDVYYLGQDGFFVFGRDPARPTSTQRSFPIGDGKIDETFFNEVDFTYINRMSVALYPLENVIVWSYVSIQATGGMPDTLLFYNYSPNATTKWSYAKIDNFLVLNPIAHGYTLDGLDVVTTNLDELPYSLDSHVWQGTTEVLGTIDSNLGLSLLNGDPLDATIQTGEAWLQSPSRTYISLIRPHIDQCSGAITAQIGTRNLESESASYGAISTLNVAGEIPVRANARFMRAKFNITGNFNVAQGFDILKTTPVGRR